MSRRIQIFTRLDPEQVETLDRIGAELGLVIDRTGETNRSETIRQLLAKADPRMAEQAS